MAKRCSFPDCEVIIEDTWVEKASKKGDFVYWVNEHNTFVHRHQLPGYSPNRPSNGTAKEASTELARIILGELKDANASEGSIAIAGELLRIASSSNSAAAIQALDRMSIRLGELPPNVHKPGPSERCSVCGRDATGRIHITIKDTTLADMGRYANELQEEIDAGEYEYDEEKGYSVKKYDDE